MAAEDDILRLTDAKPFQSSFVVFSTPVSSANGLSIAFDFYAYGGTGGDGIGFFLIDANQVPSQPGGDGGSLGYAPRVTSTVNKPGLVGGYLGIGFDEFGNFSNPTEGRIGGPGRVEDGIAVRGSASVGYRYLTGNKSLSSLDNPGAAATRENSRRRAQIDISPAGILSVQVDLNNDGDFLDLGEKPIDQFNAASVNGNGGKLPNTIRFGFAASTGGATNIHEVGGFSVKTFNSSPIPGDLTTNLAVTGGDGDDAPPSSDGNDQIDGGTGNDTLIGGVGNDLLIGGVGNDIIIGGLGADVVTGSSGADRFVFSGPSKRAALRTSTLRSRDVVTDFRFSEGDRFQLDFDNNLGTIEFPRRLFYAGRQRGNLRKATRQAYADKNGKREGDQVLRPNEAVFFKVKRRTYLSVNNHRRGFSPRNDLLVDVTGIEFKPGDLNRGVLAVPNYFA